MRTFLNVSKFLTLMVCVGVAMPLYAESAPVYDADTMQQQFDDAPSDTGSQDLPPPPPPEQEGTFVPMQGSSVAQPPARPSPPSGNLNQRITRLEQQINNLQTNESSSRVESLQAEVQSLRGQVEQLTHQVQQLQAQQKNFYSDLDKRISQKTGDSKPADTVADNTASGTDADNTPAVAPLAGAVTPKATRKTAKSVKTGAVAETKEAQAASSADGQPNVAEEQQIYQTAYNYIKAKKYTEAVNALQSMLQKYPSGQFASNAHYWLGELYSLMNKNDQALTEFETVVSTYPDSPRISDAQLKVGLIYASQSKWSDAKSIFKKVINRYPGTASARLASEQLKQIKQAGH